MIPAPPLMLPDETHADAAARCEQVARDLTFMATEHEARGRAFRERAQEYVAQAAALRREAGR